MEMFLGNRNWEWEKQEKKYWREIRKILDHQADLDVKIPVLNSHRTDFKHNNRAKFSIENKFVWR